MMQHREIGLILLTEMRGKQRRRLNENNSDHSYKILFSIMYHNSEYVEYLTTRTVTEEKTKVVGEGVTKKRRRKIGEKKLQRLEFFTLDLFRLGTSKNPHLYERKANYGQKYLWRKDIYSERGQLYCLYNSFRTGYEKYLQYKHLLDSPYMGFSKLPNYLIFLRLEICPKLLRF